MLDKPRDRQKELKMGNENWIKVDENGATGGPRNTLIDQIRREARWGMDSKKHNYSCNARKALAIILGLCGDPVELEEVGDAKP